MACRLSPPQPRSVKQIRLHGKTSTETKWLAIFVAEHTAWQEPRKSQTIPTAYPYYFAQVARVLTTAGMSSFFFFCLLFMKQQKHTERRFGLAARSLSSSCVVSTCVLCVFCYAALPTKKKIGICTVQHACSCESIRKARRMGTTRTANGYEIMHELIFNIALNTVCESGVAFE